MITAFSADNFTGEENGLFSSTSFCVYLLLRSTSAWTAVPARPPLMLMIVTFILSSSLKVNSLSYPVPPAPNIYLIFFLSFVFVTIPALC